LSHAFDCRTRISQGTSSKNPFRAGPGSGLPNFWTVVYFITAGYFT
jgi:hypothetical protein